MSYADANREARARARVAPASYPAAADADADADVAASPDDAKVWTRLYIKLARSSPDVAADLADKFLAVYRQRVPR